MKDFPNASDARWDVMRVLVALTKRAVWTDGDLVCCVSWQL